MVVGHGIQGALAQLSCYRATGHCVFDCCVVQAFVVDCHVGYRYYQTLQDHQDDNDVIYLEMASLSEHAETVDC